MHHELGTSPAMPMASDALSPATAHNSRSSSKWLATVRIDSPDGAAQHGAGGDAHRGAVRVIGGQRVGDLAGPLPTDPRRSDVTVGRPRTGAHVPAVCGMAVTGGLQMFGDQRGILVGRFRVSLDSMAAASRRCTSARSDFSCDS